VFVVDEGEGEDDGEDDGEGGEPDEVRETLMTRLTYWK